jgi:hypothetical protein
VAAALGWGALAASAAVVTGNIGGYATTCGNGINPQLPGGSGGAGAVVPGLPDLVLVAPNTMIMLDSASTMEYLPGTITLPDCTPGDPAGVNELNKWWITLEALTGTINGFSCGYDDRSSGPGGRIDAGETPAHVVAWGTGQNGDGLLDAYNGLLKFGLMTFDNESSKSNNAAGYWSYDDDHGSVNFGARNDRAERGALISVGLETKDDMSVINGMVQDEALCTIPTRTDKPVAPMLMDFDGYAKTSPDIAPPPSSGAMTGFDPWHKCRDKGSVLITDGAGDAGEGTSGYPTSAAAAATLLTGPNKIKTYVVGIGVDPADQPALNAVALAGGTGAAYFATDVASLRASLSSIFGSLANGVTTRTVPAVTDAVGATSAAQFEFSAAIEVGSGPWKGRLERTRFLCDSSLAINDTFDPAEDDFAARLDTQASRDVFTNAPTASATRTAFTAGTIPLAWVNAATAAERDATVGYVLGTSGRTTKLGDIFDSGPVIENPPALDIPIASYRSFRQFFATSGSARPGVLYAGSNDGILHAFDVASMSPDPVELWGFVPPYVLGTLKSSLTGHVFTVDGSAVVQDVILRRDLSTALPATITNPRQTGWYSVLVAPLGNGGAAVYGLDVTTPTDPASVTMMFEFADTAPDGPDADTVRETCNTGVASRTCDPDLGLVLARPGVGRAVVREGSVDKELGVAIFGGGNPPSGAAATVGRSVYVIALEDGHLIKKFDASTRCAGETAAFTSPMVGDVAAYNDFPGAFVTRFFEGDKNGVLWRFDMSSNSPATWCQSAFTPAAYRNGMPIFDAPTLALDTDGRLIVLYGTGDLANLLNTDPGNLVLSLTENVTRNPTTGAVTAVAANVNWVRTLEDGEKVAGTPVVFDSCAYFATFVPDTDGTDLCTVGHGRLWGLNYIGFNPSAGVVNDFTPCFDGDGDALTVDPVVNIELPDGSLSSGVSIVRRPACFTTDTIPDPNPSAPPGATLTRVTSFTPGTYTLTAHIGAVTSGGSVPGTIPKIERAVTPPRSGGLATSWGEIFD